MTDSLNMSVKKTTNADATITSFLLKGTSASTTDRDAGFCSGGDDDDLEIEDDIHSPTDASEDSVEVKVTPISSRNKNKRKCAEPRKVPNDDLASSSSSGPLKKRIRYEVKQESSQVDAGRQSPFRPWSVPSRPVPNTTIISSQTPSPPPASFHPVYGYQLPLACGQQEEPLSLVKTRERRAQDEYCGEGTSNSSVSDMLIIRPKEFAKIPIKLEPSPRVPPHPAVRPATASEMDNLVVLPPKTSPGFTVESLLSAASSASSSKEKCAASTMSAKDHQKEQRNYKNMTRERRIEANARERTRVHTISAAFDTLRRSIPAYSHNQKLSKLSVLRIACSYILTLSRVAGNDYSADQTAPSLASCVDLVSRTIQTEGKLRKKKDE